MHINLHRADFCHLAVSPFDILRIGNQTYVFPQGGFLVENQYAFCLSFAFIKPFSYPKA